MVKGRTWLSITPEPERELPALVATLAAGGHPQAGAVARERARVERLVLRGSQRAWLRYLHGVVELIERSRTLPDPDGILDAARTRSVAVIANHHNLLLALPGRAAALTAADRQCLAAQSTE